MGSKSKKRDVTFVERIDIDFARSLEPVRKSKSVKIVGAVAELGDQPPLYAISGAVIAVGVGMRDWRLTRTGARMMAAHAAATTLKTIFKLCIDRTRPPAAEDGRYKMAKGQRYEEAYNSFPSGHTASSVAVARALGRDYPSQHEAALTAALSIAGLQIVRGRHFLSDIVAGAALGLAAEKAVDLLLRRFPAR